MTKKPEGRLDRVEKILAQLAKSDVAFNQRFDKMEKRQDELDRRLTKRQDELDRRLTKRQEALDRRSAKHHAEFEQWRKEQRRAIDTLVKMAASADGRANTIEAELSELAKVVLTVAKSAQDMRAILSRISEAQARTDAALARMAETQASRDLEHDDLKEKLHLLYDIVDTWIRERGQHNGHEGKPKPPAS
jgi:septal ring factor EnvC (AmiA/AmiB activator)